MLLNQPPGELQQPAGSGGRWGPDHSDQVALVELFITATIR